MKRLDWSCLDRRSEPRQAGFADYAVTKLMNVMHARELASRLAGTSVTTYSLHPGGVATNIWRSLPGPVQWLLGLVLLSNEQGAQLPLYCATDPALATASGRYYSRGHEARANPLADDPALRAELWARSEAAVAG